MNIKKTLVIAFALCLLAGSGWAGDGMADGFCAEVITRGTGAGARGDELVEGREFSTRKIEDLQFEVVFHTRVEGDHVLEVDLVSPNGHSYQQVSVPITTDSTQRGGERSVARYPRPLEIQVLYQVATDNGRRQAVNFTVPVAGTTIQSSSLYGPWQVAVKVDGQGPNCLIINRFSLLE